MTRGFCLACDKPLTGKQRKWCSDACRMRYKRTIASSGKFAAGSGLQADVRQSFGFVRQPFTNEEKNTIQARIIVRYDSQDWVAEWDGFTIKTELRGYLERFLVETLQELFPRWKFWGIEVEIRKF